MAKPYKIQEESNGYFSIDGNNLQKGDYYYRFLSEGSGDDYLHIKSKYNNNQIGFEGNFPNDFIKGDDSPFTDKDDFESYVASFFFLNKNENGSQNGFIDYNDTTGSFPILADTWTDLPNDGAGAFTNKNYPPTGVTELIDVSTGYIDPTELDLGDTILIRNDYTINPNTNNAQLRFRYALGNGGGSYTLEKIIGRLDSGSGQDYRFSLTPDLIYMGDTNTRDNPIKIQVYCTSNATVTNAGSVIQVIKR